MGTDLLLHVEPGKGLGSHDGSRPIFDPGKNRESASDGVRPLPVPVKHVPRLRRDFRVAQDMDQGRARDLQTVDLATSFQTQ
jgi:hypothetical protein